ncbi:MAG: hypothetical protein MUE94_07955 [Verrucomicrobia bacterium]|jgi:hypothetical protein|nr:hypothetical protein [Verrucomicrobiota bacterium]
MSTPVIEAPGNLPGSPITSEMSGGLGFSLMRRAEVTRRETLINPVDWQED